MSQLFSTKLKKSRDTTVTGRVVESVQGLLNEQRSTMTAIGGIIGLESLNDSQETELGHAVSAWQTDFTRIAQELSIENLQPSQVEAATAAAVAVSNITSFLGTAPVVVGQGGLNSTFVGMEGLSDASATRMVSFESYDEKDNRNAVAYTVAYNLIAGRQNEFGELFFPTVTVTNDNVGVSVSIRLIQVYDDFKRDTSGKLAQYNKRNIVKAMIDGTILKNDMTRIFPVYRAGVNEASFVAGATIPAYNIVNEGETIRTAPLATGVTVDLLGLSQTDLLIANGLMDATDSIDPAISLQNVYLEVGNDILRVKVNGLATSNFVYSPQDNYRRQNLNFNTNTVMLNKDTKAIDGTDLVTLASVKTNDLVVRVKLGMSGFVNVEKGDLAVYGLEAKIDSVYNTATGLEVPLTDAPAAALVTAFGSAKIVGYDLNAYRTNLNRRQRGQLLDVTYYNQIWAVPLRSPITVLKPVNADAQSDNSDLAALVSATFVRTSNEAVRTLVQTAGMLKEYTDSRIAHPGNSLEVKAPELFGVARFLIEPTFIGENLDVLAQINSVQSHEKAKDVGAVLVQKIRDIAYRLYRDSGFQAVVDTQAAGVEGNPVVMIGTDPMTARYLMIDGENRVAGPDFEYKVVTSPDMLVMNKIFVALGYPGRNENVLNPLHFGNMLWSPELVLTLPIARGGQISKELTVQPRFRHIVNVPVMGQINVQNLPSAATLKTTVNTHEVP